MDFYVVAAFEEKTYGVFDTYRDARDLYASLEPNEYLGRYTVDLLCMHPCGCLYRAMFEESVDIVVGDEPDEPLGILQQQMRHQRILLEMADSARQGRPKMLHTHWRRTWACPRHGSSEEWAMYGYDDKSQQAADERAGRRSEQ